MNKAQRQQWTAFEVGVLSQHRVESVAIPFAGAAQLDWNLKLFGRRVLDNDICQWAWWIARARVENNSEQLSYQDADILLDEHSSPTLIEGLLEWFDEEDAIILCRIRENIERLRSDARRALAMFAGILTGDYALSFSSSKHSLRRPLTTVFRELLPTVNRIIDNQKTNSSANLEAIDFIIRTRADLLYINLPPPGGMQRFLTSKEYWREVWVRGESSACETLRQAVRDSLSGNICSKERYLQALTDLLEHAKHIPNWAIGFQEGALLTFEDIKQLVKNYRRVETSYFKDFSETLAGGKACITIASDKL